MSESLSKYIGWRNWAVFRYNSVFENLFILFLIALIGQRSDWAFLKDSLLFILFSIFFSFYGYLVNDYSDIELDRLHGKPNTFKDDSRNKAQLVLLVILFLAVLTSIPFWDRPYFIVLTLIWFLLTTFYSLPPVRLKERGTANIVIVVMAQRLLPILILFAVFNFWDVQVLISLLIYVLLRGLASDMNHQLEDYRNDKKTGTRTFAVSQGYQKVSKWFSVIQQLEKIMLAIILLQITFHIDLNELFTRWLWIGTGGLYFAGLIWFFLDRRQWTKNPFDPEERNLAQFLHHAFPTVALPLVLNVIAMTIYFPFVILLLFQIFIRRLYSLQILKNNFMVEFLIQKLRG